MSYRPDPSVKETERLAALDSYGILDSPRERDFDDVAELASEICGTPIGIVNFIGGGRQFFKAETGLGVRETPLDSSFCAKAILEEDFLLIPDATQDARFDCNPLVIGPPGLRFYAGALLKTDEGHAVGTVCVLDYQPRQLSGLQVKALRVLARQIVKQLELRRALREKHKAEERQIFLTQEMAHRLKNTLAMVQAIASQTLRGVTERDAVKAFEGRLIALGQAHDVLVQENWIETPIQQTVKLVLALHDDRGRIVSQGPPLLLNARATLSLSMLLHELATNATKYGALSQPAGRIDISWSVDGSGANRELVMSWHEAGGPSVEAPSRRGFGTRIIGMGIAGAGNVEREFLPSGLRAVFRAPLDMLQI